MDKLKEQIQRFKGVDIWEVISYVMFQNKNYLLELIQGQLWEGKKKTGTTKVYSRSQEVQEYIQMKKAFGRIAQSTLPYANLYNEGDFYEGMDFVIKKNLIEIFSRDEKASGLEAKYGSDIYELNSENMIELKNRIFPEVMAEIRKRLNYQI